MLKPVSPTEVRDLLRNGARLVDIREPDEYESVHVEGAEPLPLSLARYMRPAPSTPEKPVIFTCHSGNRVGQNERMLEDLAGGPAYKMVGGTDGWISAALPVRRGMKYSLERQVRIAAGSLVFLGTLCGIVIHPAFLAVPLFVGGGLVFAGLTGFCGLGELLKKLPWNVRV